MSKYIPVSEHKVTSNINKHMTHAEDLVLLGGEKGLEWVVGMFKQLHAKLKGNTEEDKIKLSIKFDGSPSVFVWSKFPNLGYNGIAVKAIFNKERKIMFNDEEIDSYYELQPELASKLKILSKYLHLLNIPKGEIWQGDFLFDKSTLREDEDHYSFHPNTIVYKVNRHSELGTKIHNAEIGVVWHTRYKGDSLDAVSAKYNTRINELNNIPEVFMTDPYVHSIAGKVTLSEYENEEFIEKIRFIELNAKFLATKPEYKEIIYNSDFLTLFTMFQNSLIKKNKHIETPEDFIEELVYFVNDKYKREIALRKSPKGKAVWEEKLNSTLNIIENNDCLHVVIETIQLLTALKLLFIKKLNNINSFETFLLNKDRKNIHTGDEGFAVSDIYGNVVKLVDRYEFSFANFSPNILKGWSK